jgi:flavin reductase (DIM6/NTAB) family NADH-FMN oxidoreductase RutF
MACIFSANFFYSYDEIFRSYDQRFRSKSPCYSPCQRTFSTVTMKSEIVLQLRRKSHLAHKKINERKLSVDPNIKKQALRTFTYGLYAVSCANEGDVNIFTANWLTQVSFDPPLLAVSVENDSKSLGMILRSRKFTVNVYRTGEREMAGKLGKSAIQHPNKLNGIEYALGANGCPVMRDALAWVACEVRHTAPAGDSTLIVAEVMDVGMLADGQPLTMAEAGFRHAG